MFSALEVLGGLGLFPIGMAVVAEGLKGLAVEQLRACLPASFPPNTFVGRMLLLLIGIGITLVTQSSSAGVATAITAVHIGTITLPQAAAMVIGMDVGTTLTAAAIGGSVNARRTGIAHVVYNLMTGVMAFAILPMFVAGWMSWSPLAMRQIQRSHWLLFTLSSIPSASFLCFR